MIFFSKKYQKSVFAKSFRPQRDTFWQKQIFDFFGVHPPKSRKTVIFGRNVTFGRSGDPKIGISKWPHARPRAPPCTKISRDPPTTIPRLPCNFGGDCGRSAREIREKHVFGRVPPPLADRAPRVPKTTKTATSRVPDYYFCPNFQGGLGMV